MVVCNSDTKFINFLHNELELKSEDIAVALRHRESKNGPLPMLLWQYGLVSIEQLERIFDWLETQSEQVLQTNLEHDGLYTLQSIYRKKQRYNE
ncbi:MAG: DUF2949 domain-containing protein [Calothrix sp. SM1_7_51]|nr:DUF2949 domain-containing protein [Calothrix sp. SM1_7_51]